MDLELLKTLILNHHDQELPEFYTRDLSYELLPKKALILKGMRRTGKSTFTHQILTDLKKQKVPIQNTVYINFVDERLHQFKRENFQDILEAYFQIYPEKRHKQKVYYFFDEIQMIDGWESFIERLLQQENCQVIITGSSAKMLSQEIATTMRGRSLSYEVFPFSFQERLSRKNIEYNKLTSQNQGYIQNEFNDYFEKGGFPEILDLQNKQTVTQILQEYYRTVLYRDIIDRNNANDPHLIGEILYEITLQTSCFFSINKLTDKMKSLGFKTYPNEVSKVLKWFEDCYYLYTLPLYTRSIQKQRINPKKAYLIDHGLARQINNKLSQNEGRLLENLIYMELRRRFENLYYYKTKSNFEIDFIYEGPCQTELVQVSLNIDDEQTKERECRALKEGMQELQLKESTLVTLNQEETIQDDSETITIKPAWKFLIEL